MYGGHAQTEFEGKTRAHSTFPLLSFLCFYEYSVNPLTENWDDPFQASGASGFVVKSLDRFRTAVHLKFDHQFDHLREIFCPPREQK